jgi:hypothetical protein
MPLFPRSEVSLPYQYEHPVTRLVEGLLLGEKHDGNLDVAIRRDSHGWGEIECEPFN